MYNESGSIKNTCSIWSLTENRWKLLWYFQFSLWRKFHDGKKQVHICNRMHLKMCENVIYLPLSEGEMVKSPHWGLWILFCPRLQGQVSPFLCATQVSGGEKSTNNSINISNMLFPECTLSLLPFSSLSASCSPKKQSILQWYLQQDLSVCKELLEREPCIRRDWRGTARVCYLANMTWPSVWPFPDGFLWMAASSKCFRRRAYELFLPSR